MIIQNIQYISYFTLCIYCWTQAHVLWEEEYDDDSWEKVSGAKSIGKAINSCREYCLAKYNTVITANPTQISSPAHSWSQGQGQMVFSYTEREKEATGRLRKSPELVSMGLGSPTGASRQGLSLGWCGSWELLPCFLPDDRRLSLNPSSLQNNWLGNIPETHCRSHLFQLVLGRGWWHISEARGKRVPGLGVWVRVCFFFVALIYCQSSLTSIYLLLLAGWACTLPNRFICNTAGWSLFLCCKINCKDS